MHALDEREQTLTWKGKERMLIWKASDRPERKENQKNLKWLREKKMTKLSVYKRDYEISFSEAKLSSGVATFPKMYSG